MRVRILGDQGREPEVGRSIGFGIYISLARTAVNAPRHKIYRNGDGACSRTTMTLDDRRDGRRNGQPYSHQQKSVAPDDPENLKRQFQYPQALRQPVRKLQEAQKLSGNVHFYRCYRVVAQRALPRMTLPECRNCRRNDSPGISR